MKKLPLLGNTLSELTKIATDFGMPAYTGKQLSEWIYKKNVHSIQEMTNISAINKEKLEKLYEVGIMPPAERQASIDGTVKYLFQTSSGHFIESVFIPEDNRATLCISSQVGCKMNCSFCMTGKQGFSKNLTSCDILNQFYSIPEYDQLTNIVFMGMGEPLDNLDQVLKTLDILTADYGQAWSAKRITLSTIGLIPAMKTFLEKSTCHLAISMHSPFAEERLRLMPMEKKYPINSILNELSHYDFSKQRRVSFEYIMFDGLNDTLRHAIEMKKLLKDIHCRVNLIRYHSIPGENLKTSDEEKMVVFRDYLTNNGITATIRKSRGEDIFAACGMLSSLKHA